MKRIRSKLCLWFLLTLFCSFTLGVCQINTATQKDRALGLWTMNYYLHPTPDAVPDQINQWNQSQFLERFKGSAEAPMTMFLAQIFKQNSKKIPAWMKQVHPKSDEQKKFLFQVLWTANTPESISYLTSIANGANSKEAAMAKLIMATPPKDILSEQINPDVLDELWASFFATGDKYYVERIISVLSWKNPFEGSSPKEVKEELADKKITKEQVMQGLTVQAAQWSLTSNAILHATVFKICLDYAKKADPITQRRLAEVLKQAAEQQREIKAGKFKEAKSG